MPPAPFVFIFIGLRLGVAVWANQPEIVQTVVDCIAIFVIQL
jgi:hypothetical protein